MSHAKDFHYIKRHTCTTVDEAVWGDTANEMEDTIDRRISIDVRAAAWRILSGTSVPRFFSDPIRAYALDYFTQPTI